MSYSINRPGSCAGHEITDAIMVLTSGGLHPAAVKHFKKCLAINREGKEKAIGAETEY